MNLKKDWFKLLIVAVGGLYMLNMTGGFIEFIPDITPVIGNLDEAVATVIAYHFGTEIFKGKK